MDASMNVGQLKDNQAIHFHSHSSNYDQQELTGEMRCFPGAVRVSLTNSLDAEILERLAESPFVGARTLASLAFNASIKVRQAVAYNVMTPVESLLMLARDENVGVRFQLARNQNLPKLVLEVLSDDENSYVRWRALSTIYRKAANQSRQMNYLRGLPAKTEKASGRAIHSNKQEKLRAKGWLVHDPELNR